MQHTNVPWVEHPDPGVSTRPTIVARLPDLYKGIFPVSVGSTLEFLPGAPKIVLGQSYCCVQANPQQARGRRLGAPAHTTVNR